MQLPFRHATTTTATTKIDCTEFPLGGGRGSHLALARSLICQSVRVPPSVCLSDRRRRREAKLTPRELADELCDLGPRLRAFKIKYPSNLWIYSSSVLRNGRGEKTRGIPRENNRCRVISVWVAGIASSQSSSYASRRFARNEQEATIRCKGQRCEKFD